MVQLNKYHFRHSVPEILDTYDKQGIEYMGHYAALSGVPLVYVYEFVMENRVDAKSECEKRIKAIKDFYGA